MKSKLYKLQKKEMKDAFEDERDFIDKQFDDLVADSSLQFRSFFVLTYFFLYI